MFLSITQHTDANLLDLLTYTTQRQKKGGRICTNLILIKFGKLLLIYL